MKVFSNADRVTQSTPDQSVSASITTPSCSQKPVSPKRPSVLFANQIHSIKNDTIPVDETWKTQVDAITQTAYPELTLSNGDYLLIKNAHTAIRFFDAAYQMEFGSHFSQRFQSIQAFMSDYVKEGNITGLTQLGKDIILVAKSIDIDIFNPNKISTKIAKLLGSRRQKVIKIRKEFDYACDQIDARIDRVLNNLSEVRDTLIRFQEISEEIHELQHQLQLSMVALSLTITQMSHSATASQGAYQNTEARNQQTMIERWNRKVSTLRALYQSITLTLPQVDLYQSNLLNGFEQIEEIKINLIQVWKQQFLTVIAVDESSDTSLFYDLYDAQQLLVDGIKERNLHGL